MTAQEPVEYILDENNRILGVSGGWDAFAIGNGAPELAGSSVHGRALLDFLSGKVTKRFVQRLLDTARCAGKPVHIDYRCDSPEQRRFICMEVIPLAKGQLRLRHHLRRSESRANPLTVRKAGYRHKDTLIRCSICNQLKYKGSWTQIETAAGNGEIFVVYGICPQCQHQLDILESGSGV